MAKKKTGLSESALLAITHRVISSAEDLNSTKLKREREDVLAYYRGEMPKPLHKGDSKYVSRDVFDGVDSMRATIAETFLAHQRIVSFVPEYGETVAEAKQASEYTRHVFYKHNDGEGIIYDSLGGGLMERLAVCKVSFKEVADETEYSFDAMTEEELDVFIADFDEPELVDVTKDETGQLYTGKVKDAKVKQRVCVDLIPPEDIMVSGYSTSITTARGVVHREWKTKSQLLADGFDEFKVEKIKFEDGSASQYDTEKDRRFDPVGAVMFGEDSYQEATRGTTVHEVYVELDMENRGVAKLWKITVADDVILDKEQVARKPFAAFIPLPIPHMFLGDNYASSIVPTQNARTILFRQIINHSLITNNARMQVLNGAVPNPNELMDVRLGGIVNVRRPDAITPLPQAPLNPYVFNLIQLLDEDKEEVTGISKLSQGLNKDAISTQNSQGMVEQLINQSQIRQKVIARQFGRFMRQLWDLIYATAVDHVTQDEYVSVTGAYVPVNPSRWKQRKGATVGLSLGYGEQEKEGQKWVEIDQYFSQDPALAQGYTPTQRYEVITRALEFRGIEDITSILTPPEKIEPKPPSEMETLSIEQVKSQIAYQKAQSYAMTTKADTDKFNAETKRLELMADTKNDAATLKLKYDELAAEQDMANKEFAAAQAADETRGIMSPN